MIDLPQESLSVRDIEEMNYVQFISLLQETNRCPGGKYTIRRILQNSFIRESSLVLDVGCNTGFSSLEIARSTGCKVVGIDVIPDAINASQNLLSTDTVEIQRLVDFELGSALNLRFSDNHFDLVVTGGATSFMDDKQRAINEYYRVLKPWGFLSVTNLCYMKPPPSQILADVSNEIGVSINAWGPADWLDLFSRQNRFEIYMLEKYQLSNRPDSLIEDYIDYFMAKEHLSVYSTEVKAAIRKRWQRTISIFNENHKYLGFILVLFRKAHIKEEPELFSQFEMV